jgi:serine/threonine-protein kinase PpkA
MQSHRPAPVALRVEMAELPEIPGYRLLKLIKQSKRSRTFLAEQQSLARQVALKVLSEEFFDDPALRQRFVEEGKSAARLNHPHVLSVFDIGSAGGYPFIATEFVGGGTLRERLQQPMAPVEALRIARDLAAALDYAHSQGVVHRDIKPSNILLRSDGSAVLGDLGIGKAQSGDTAAVRMGSPHYMSPEQIEGQQGDGRADLYSLGVVLFEMLAGRTPYDSDDPFQVAAKHLSEPVPRLAEALSRYQGLIDRLLAKSPAERYEGARELVDAIDAFIEPRVPVREQRPAPVRGAPRAVSSPAAPMPATVIQPAISVASAPAGQRAILAPPTAAVDTDGRPAGNPAKAAIRILTVLFVVALLGYGLMLAWQAFNGSEGSAPGQDAMPAASRQLSGAGAPGADLVQRVGEQLAKGHWFEPVGDAAYDTIRALEAQSGAQAGKALREQLAASVDARVLELQQAGKDEEARRLLASALSYLPEDATLVARRQALEAPR